MAWTASGSPRVLWGVAVFVPAAAVPAGLAIGRGASPEEAAELVRVFAALVATGAGVLSLVCWRLLGKAFASWRAIALVDLGVLTLLSNSLDLLGVGPRPGAEILGRLLTGLLVAAAAVISLRSAEVDAALHPSRWLAGSLVLGVCLLGSVNLLAVHDLLPTWAAGTTSRAVVALGLGAGFLGLGATAWRAELGRRGRWAPGVLVGLGLAYGAGLVPALASDSWSLAGAILRLAAVALAAASVVGELAFLLRCQDRQAVRLQGDLAGLRAAIEEERKRLEERLHDLRDAVTALRSADSTLRQHADRLDRPTQSSLAEAVTAELARLQVLIEPDRPLDRVGFRLGEALAPVLDAERSRGADLLVDLQDLAVRGDPGGLARVLQNLLVNARQYAPGTPVRLRAVARGHQVEIWVEDGGPGISPSERLAVFGRGERGSTSEGTEGSGLGLFVAAQLMAEMGGSIRLGDPEATGRRRGPSLADQPPPAGPQAAGAGRSAGRPGAGGCFVLELPAAPGEAVPLADTASGLTADRAVSILGAAGPTLGLGAAS